MDEGLLSLRWNHHQSTFFSELGKLREKDRYSDVTLACDGELFPAHKLVLSSCSEYFDTILENTQCKCPIIVLKDIGRQQLSSLLRYMYLGEAEVKQCDLPSLIKAAECLRIKGLAIPDKPPPDPIIPEIVSNVPKKDSSNSQTKKRTHKEINTEGNSASASKRVKSIDTEVPNDDTVQIKREVDDFDSTSETESDRFKSENDKTDDLLDTASVDIKSEHLNDTFAFSNFTDTEDHNQAGPSNVEGDIGEGWQDNDSMFSHGLFNTSENSQQNLTLEQTAAFEMEKKYHWITTSEQSQMQTQTPRRKSFIRQSDGVMILPSKSGNIEIKRAEDQSFLCPFCTYRSIHHTNIARHVRIHTGDRPFKCAHCNFSCRDQGGLKRHLHIHKKQPQINNS